jgi:hypothetical protein
MTIFAKLSSFGVQKEFMLSKALVLLSQLIASANRFCGNVTDIKIEIAYFRFQINGIQVSLPIKIGSSNEHLVMILLKLI